MKHLRICSTRMAARMAALPVLCALCAPDAHADGIDEGATVIPFNTTVAAAIDNFFDRDVYSFNAGFGREFRIRVFETGIDDVDLEVRDQFGIEPYIVTNSVVEGDVDFWVHVPMGGAVLFLDIGAFAEFTSGGYEVRVVRRAIVDGDGDGMADQWEIAIFGGTGAAPNVDKDGDGWTNLEEYLLGTDPMDALSGLFLTEVANLSPAHDLTWTSVPTRHYGIYRGNSPVGGPWTLIDTMTATGLSTSFTDPNASAPAMQIYRVELAP